MAAVSLLDWRSTCACLTFVLACAYIDYRLQVYALWSDWSHPHHSQSFYLKSQVGHIPPLDSPPIMPFSHALLFHHHSCSLNLYCIPDWWPNQRSSLELTCTITQPYRAIGCSLSWSSHARNAHTWHRTLCNALWSAPLSACCWQPRQVGFYFWSEFSLSKLVTPSSQQHLVVNT